MHFFKKNMHSKFTYDGGGKRLDTLIKSVFGSLKHEFLMETTNPVGSIHKFRKSNDKDKKIVPLISIFFSLGKYHSKDNK